MDAEELRQFWTTGWGSATELSHLSLAWKATIDNVKPAVKQIILSAPGIGAAIGTDAVVFMPTAPLA